MKGNFIELIHETNCECETFIKFFLVVQKLYLLLYRLRGLKRQQLGSIII